MSNAVGVIRVRATDEPARLFRPPKLILWPVGMILAVWLAVSAGEYLGTAGRASVAQPPANPGDATTPAVRAQTGTLPVLITGASGTMVWIVTFIGVARWRRKLRRQWQKNAAKAAEEMEALQRQLAESRKVAEKQTDALDALRLQMAAEQRKAEWLVRDTEAQMQNRLTDLTQKLATLETELNQRRKYEKSLSEQRLCLETSNTVLELHVQERTEAVQQLQQRHDLILNSAGDGICGVDLTGKVAFANPAAARLTGWSLEEMIGKTEREVFHANNGAAPAQPPAAPESPVFHRKNGNRFPVELVRTPIEEKGRKSGEVLIFKDITERKRAAVTLSQKMAELSRSNNELEQFAFVASHDLQEPLRKIQAMGDRLRAKCQPLLPPETLDYLDRMQAASARMRSLIDDLLTFSRVIRDAQPFEPVELSGIVRDVLGDLEERIERSGGRVEVGDLPRIEADATQMRQLLLNLIGNALKFQPPGGCPLVKVAARTSTPVAGEEYCELTVEDNGIGFEAQYSEKIFAVFQRLHGRGEYEGTGVGLAICRRIADRHGGSITATGQPGKGATFTVRLPLRQSTPKNVS
jgi:PAS domain S-box-containing protein